MSVHRIARADLDVSLRAIVRGGERIDHIDLDEAAGEYVVITEDRIETRPVTAESQSDPRLMDTVWPR